MPNTYHQWAKPCWNIQTVSLSMNINAKNATHPQTKTNREANGIRHAQRKVIKTASHQFCGCCGVCPFICVLLLL